MRFRTKGGFLWNDQLNWEKRRAIIFEPSFSHFLLLDSRIKFNI